MLKAVYCPNQTEPTHYYLINRAPMYRRTIGNFKEIVEFIKNEYPQYNWETFDEHTSLREQAIVYNQAKFLFSPTGSNLARIFFMQKGALVLSDQVSFNDYMMESLAICLQVRIIAFSSSTINTFDVRSHNIDIPFLNRMFNFSLYTLKNGHFPPTL
jgi:hypothetical protein